MEIQATKVFSNNWELINDFSITDFRGTYKECIKYADDNVLPKELILPGYRWIVNQGSSRSSKTYSICQALILWAIDNPNMVISVVRKTLSALKTSAMKDFFEVLKSMGLYKRANHNKTSNTYNFDNGTEIEFFGADDEQKLRGRKRHICWLNEANEMWEDDVLQLNLRTTLFFLLDYNPSERASWIYDLSPTESKIIKSTFKMNPFLTQAQINEIEGLKDKDEALYTIFALGERAITRENIFSNWTFVPSKPSKFTQYIYAIDYGFTHPTALVKIWYYEDEIFVEDIIYEPGMTSSDIVSKFRELGITHRDIIIAEVARPEINAELRRENFNIIDADKNVKGGINDVQRTKVHTSSKNIWKEYENYSWRKVRGQLTEEPVKILDDAIDGIRYGTRYIVKFFRGNTKTFTFH